MKLLKYMLTSKPPNNPLQPELESCAVIEYNKPDKLILIESVLANLSNPVKRGRWTAARIESMSIRMLWLKNLSVIFVSFGLIGCGSEVAISDATATVELPAEAKASRTPIPTETPTPTMTFVPPTSTLVSDQNYWVNVYGADVYNLAAAVQETEDGDYIVVGHSLHFTKTTSDSIRDNEVRNVWLLKLNHDGTVVWGKTYPSTGHDIPRAIQETSDGGYIIGGVTLQVVDTWSGGRDIAEGIRTIWALKLNQDGMIAWKKTYGDFGYDNDIASIQETRDGHYILGGAAADRIAIRVLKLNQEGMVVWQKSYRRATYFEKMTSLEPVDDGGYIISGTASCSVGVLKLTDDGTIAWHRFYRFDECFSPHLRVTRDGGYIFLGMLDRSTWVLRMDQDGKVEWQKTFEVTLPSSIHEVSDGGYIVTGRRVTNEDYDSWFLKLNRDGTVAWHKSYGEANRDTIDSIQQTRDGNYVAVGNTNSFINSPDTAIWVLKLGSNGDLPDCSILGPSNGSVLNSITSHVDFKEDSYELRLVSSTFLNAVDTPISSEDMPLETKVICDETKASFSTPIPTATVPMAPTPAITR
jgi:hypothetical protein